MDHLLAEAALLEIRARRLTVPASRVAERGKITLIPRCRGVGFTDWFAIEATKVKTAGVSRTFGDIAVQRARSANYAPCFSAVNDRHTSTIRPKFDICSSVSTAKHRHHQLISEACGLRHAMSRPVSSAFR